MTNDKAKSKALIEEETFYSQIATARNTSFQLGISGGLEQGSKFLLDEAGREFVAGNDQLAKCLRDYARKLQIRSENERKSYDHIVKEYRKEHPEWEWL